MRTSLFIVALLIGPIFNLLGQQSRIDSLEQVVKSIDNDVELRLTEFDMVEIRDRATDGGWMIEVYSDQNEIKKVKEEIGLSFGRITTIIYLDNEKPIKIIDREENFAWNKEESGWDYSELNLVFQEDIYVFDWNMADTDSIVKGKRNLSEETCGVFEYESLLETVSELQPK